MSKIEILAPVGSEEMLRAAVFSGADAVYLGFSGFNARTGAGNFDADSLKEAVRFCHARGVAVHVALNTTVYGTELPALEQAIRSVAASGADGRPATMHLTKCMLLIMPLSCAFMQKGILALITMDGVKMMFTDSSASMVLMINQSPTKCIMHLSLTQATIANTFLEC